MATYSGKIKFLNETKTIAIIQDTTVSGDSDIHYKMIKGDLSLAQRPDEGSILEDVVYADSVASDVYDVVPGTAVLSKRYSREDVKQILTFRDDDYSLMLSKADIADGYFGVAYSQTLTASGGTSPYTFSRLSGSLPTGLTLVASTGKVSGTPAAVGDFSVTFRVTDANSKTDDQIINFSILYETLAITTTELEDITEDTEFTQTLAATGGDSDYTWASVGDDLPAGLTLTAATGIIAGTPTEAGAYSIDIEVTDGNGAKASQNFSGTVAAAG